MKENMLEYYRLIGEIHNLVTKADSLFDALQSCLRLIISGGNAQHAIVWILNEDDKALHPYYWISPTDYTSMVYRLGEGDIGQCYNQQKTVYAADTAKPGHSVCIPFSNKHQQLGVFQFEADPEGSGFDEETIDTFEILSLMVAMEIGDNPRFQKPWNAGKTVLQVRNVTKSFVNGSITTKVLKGVNLDVYEGEFLVLLGESGCGKSTLLNILGGMDKADGGTVNFLGMMDITNADETQLTQFRRDNIGFIFQSYNLMPNLNAKQNLDLIGELVDHPMKSEEALEMVGLSDRAANYPSQLSGGQQQRISIARALVKHPKLIFADEPTAALDYATSIEVLDVLEKVVHSGTTMVMVTHNEEITKMADRVVRMRNGRMYEVTVNRFPLHANELVW